MYGIPNCGTCKNAKKWLESHGHKVELADLKMSSPSETTLLTLIQQSGLDVDRFFNTSGEVYKTLSLKDKIKSMSLDEKLHILSSNGMLMKRPVVTDGKTTTVGFKEETYQSVWGSH
ncbi:Spx/MgsR family RNA polymerase-binding regulatory protein [Gorillibacterium massiliense]|uniref:Spx/MgsR family RNA polymerase-binding regulatory protein n=1 Tax=Gorillibacterium massiliense TaxID=1280390 RepID=UPI0004B664EB|nr:Spx/MgsR family RNA polymerase-binding regulatory protein [Gorillibacterium massiliense]